MAMNRKQRRRQAKKAHTERRDLAVALATLRRRAFHERGQRVHCVLAGWSFVMSVDAFDELRTPGRAPADQAALGLSLFGVDLSALPPCVGPGRCPHDHLHLSARLSPTDRATVPDDWENLGVACAAARVPVETARSAVENTNEVINQRAIHFIWYEEHAKQA